MNDITKNAVEAMLRSDPYVTEDRRAAVALALETPPGMNAVAEIGGVILPEKAKPEGTLLERWKEAFGHLEAEPDDATYSAIVPNAVAVFKAIPVGMPFVRGDKFEELIRDSGIPVPPSKKYWVRDRMAVLIEAGLLRKCGRSSHTVKLVKDSEYSPEMDEMIAEAARRVGGRRHAKKTAARPNKPDGVPLPLSE